MLIKKISLALMLLLTTFSISNAIVITGFGNTSDFTVDPVFSTFPVINVNPTNVNVVGSDFGQSLAGTFTPIDISGFTLINLTGTLTGTNPNTTFTILLFNSGFDQTREYSGVTNSFSSSSSTYTLTFVSETSSFTDIAGFQFTGGGLGSPLNFTFDSLEAIAVPEPSTYTLIGMGLGGLVLFRRFRKVAA